MSQQETARDAEARIPIAVAEAWMKAESEYRRIGNGWIRGPAIRGEPGKTSWHGLYALGAAILRAEERDTVTAREAADIRDGVRKAVVGKHRLLEIE